MAPEIIGAKPADQRGDMYSWGMSWWCVIMLVPNPPAKLEEQAKVRAGFKFHRAPLAGPPGGLRAGGGGKGGGAEGRWGMGGPSGAPGGGQRTKSSEFYTRA